MNKCKSCVNINKMEQDYKPNIYFSEARLEWSTSILVSVGNTLQT